MPHFRQPLRGERGPRTFTVSGAEGLGSGSPDLLVDAVVRGTGNLVKEGNGELELTGENANFTGSVTVNAGTVIAGSSGALGSAAAGVTVNNSGCLALANGVEINESLTLDSDAPISLFQRRAPFFRRTGTTHGMGRFNSDRMPLFMYRAVPASCWTAPSHT